MGESLIVRRGGGGGLNINGELVYRFVDPSSVVSKGDFISLQESTASTIPVRAHARPGISNFDYGVGMHVNTSDGELEYTIAEEVNERILVQRNSTVLPRTWSSIYSVALSFLDENYFVVTFSTGSRSYVRLYKFDRDTKQIIDLDHQRLIEYDTTRRYSEVTPINEQVAVIAYGQNTSGGMQLVRRENDSLILGNYVDLNIGASGNPKIVKISDSKLCVIYGNDILIVHYDSTALTGSFVPRTNRVSFGSFASSTDIFRLSDDKVLLTFRRDSNLHFYIYDLSDETPTLLSEVSYSDPSGGINSNVCKMNSTDDGGAVIVSLANGMTKMIPFNVDTTSYQVTFNMPIAFDTSALNHSRTPAFGTIAKGDYKNTDEWSLWISYVAGTRNILLAKTDLETYINIVFEGHLEKAKTKEEVYGVATKIKEDKTEAIVFTN